MSRTEDGDYIWGTCVKCQVPKMVDPEDHTCIDCWMEEDKEGFQRRKADIARRAKEPERVKGRCEGIEGVALVAGCGRGCNLVPETHLCVPCHADHLKRKLLGDAIEPTEEQKKDQDRLGFQSKEEEQPQPPAEEAGTEKEDREMGEKKEKQKQYHKTGICPECTAEGDQEEKKLWARGLCGKHSTRFRRDGTLDEKYPSKYPGRNRHKKKKTAPVTPPPTPSTRIEPEVITAGGGHGEEPAGPVEPALERMRRTHAPGARMSDQELKKSLQEKAGFDTIFEEGVTENLINGIQILVGQANSWRKRALVAEEKLKGVRDLLAAQAGGGNKGRQGGRR